MTTSRRYNGVDRCVCTFLRNSFPSPQSLTFPGVDTSARLSRTCGSMISSDEYRQKAEANLLSAKDPLTQLRYKLLKKGVAGIKEFAR